MNLSSPVLGAMIRRDVAPEHVVQHAVDLATSFDELWVVDDLPFAGGVSQMAAILQATDDVVVGHGIAPAPFRTPAALAMEWATLERMFPGRVACGLGHGVQTWMSQLGEQVDSPLTLIRETCSAVRELLAGATVTTAGRYVVLDGVALEFPPLVSPPVSLGVMGPRSLEISGAVADGTILCEAHGPAEISLALDRVRAGQASEGRQADHRITVYAAFHVGDVADIVRNPDAPVGWEAVSTDPLDVARSIVSLYQAGADSAVLVPLGSDPRGSLAEASRTVVPLVREHLATLSGQNP